MDNLAILKELNRIDEMLALRAQAQRAGDPESLIVVRMMDNAVEGARRQIKDAVSAVRFRRLERRHPSLREQQA